MVGYLGALATDFDGTLSHDGQRPADDVLVGLRKLRDAGYTVLLVTGRILEELEHVFPDVIEHVDGIVAENGCVLHTTRGHRLLATPVDERLVTRLRDRGIDIRAGEVLQACHASDRVAVLEEIRELELDSQLVFNRSELMVLPPGITKGTGLFEALGDLDISRHSTVGVGDAENDRALLDVCEVGVAVADSVESLLRFADVTAPGPDGAGVLEFAGSLLRGHALPIHSRRWQIRLGTGPDGATASVPSSQLSILVCGAPGSGKSHLTGLLAERLIAQGYCVLVIDPEGDHQGLGRLRGVQIVDGRDGLPAPHVLTRRFTQRYSSVVLDLSQVPEREWLAYLDRLGDAVRESRRSAGMPHWVIADEAHTSTGSVPADDTDRWGYCLATYRPDLIRPSVLDRMHVVVLLGSGEVPAPDWVALLTRIDPQVAELGRLDVGDAYLAISQGLGASMPFRVATRVTEHHRHWHKYVDAHLPDFRCFFFRDGKDERVAAASNLREFQAVLAACGADVVAHHCAGGDFSRWLDVVLADRFLATQVADIEQQVRSGDVGAEAARDRLLGCVRRSYRVG